MAINDTDTQTLLAQATPNAPSADDASAAKDSAQAQSAQQLSNAARTIPVSPAEFKKPMDAGLSVPSAPGSFGYHFSNALEAAKKNTDPAVLAQPGGWSKLMIGTTLDAVAAKGASSAPAPLSNATAAPAPQSAEWDAARSNKDASAPAAAPAQGSGRGRRIAYEALSSLGDITAAPGPGGAMGGFARTTAARNERERLEATNRQSLATSNSQMLHEQALTHKMGEDQIAASAKIGNQGAEAILGAHIPGEKLAEGKTSDELNQMIQSKQINPSEDTVFLTGRALTGKDANGQPMYRSTYTVIKPAGEVDLTGKDEEMKFIKDNTGIDLKGKNGDGAKVSAVDFNGLWQQASNAATTRRAFEAKGAQDDKIIRENQSSKDAEGIFRNPTVMNARVGHDASTPGHEDPFAVVKTFDYFMNHPDDVKKTGISNFSEAYMKAAGGEAYFKDLRDKYQAAQAKATDTIDGMLTKAETDPKEIEGHTPAFTSAMKSLMSDPNVSPDKKKRAAAVLSTVQDVRQGEIDLERAKAEGKKEAATGFTGNPDATSPEVFFSSLKPEEQSIVKLIGSGRAPMVRLEYLVAKKPEVMEAVERAYPGQFDGSKVKSYIDTYKDFTSGKTSIALNSGGTALTHLHELQGLNTADSHIPHTPAWTAYQNKADTVSSELAKFYGDATIPAIASIKETLTSTLPGNRNAAITTQAKSMGDKMDSFETQWKNAAPSTAYQAPMPHISAQAKQARSALDPNYATQLKSEQQSDEKTQSRAQQAPAPQTHVFNSQAWGAANPGKDINAAIAQAKKMGYEVQ